MTIIDLALLVFGCGALFFGIFSPDRKSGWVEMGIGAVLLIVLALK